MCAFYEHPSFNIHLKDAEAKSPFNYPIASGNDGLIKQLIIRGADITTNIVNKGEASEHLKAAIDIGNLKAVRNLVTLYKDLYEQQINGDSPINYALSKNHTTLYLSMLTLKPDLSEEDKKHAHEFLNKNQKLIKDLIINVVDLSLFMDQGKLPAGCQQYVSEDNLAISLKEALDNDNFQHFKNLCIYNSGLQFQLIEDKNILTYAIENSGDRNDLSVSLADFGLIDDEYLKEPNKNNALNLAIILEDVGEVSKQLKKGRQNIEASFVNAIKSENIFIVELFLKAIPENPNERLSAEYLMEAVKASKSNEDILKLL